MKSLRIQVQEKWSCVTVACEWRLTFSIGLEWGTRVCKVLRWCTAWSGFSSFYITSNFVDIVNILLKYFRGCRQKVSNLVNCCIFYYLLCGEFYMFLLSSNFIECNFFQRWERSERTLQTYIICGPWTSLCQEKKNEVPQASSLSFELGKFLSLVWWEKIKVIKSIHRWFQNFHGQRNQ